MSSYKKKCHCCKPLINPDAIDCSHINDHCDECSPDKRCCAGDDALIIKTVSCCDNCYHNDDNYGVPVANGRGLVQDDDTKLAFAFKIKRENGCYSGKLCVADYNSDTLISSDDLECYTQSLPFSFTAVFTVPDNNNVRRNVTLCCLEEICGNPAQLFVYSPPFCNAAEISTGGPVVEGYIKITDRNPN